MARANQVSPTYSMGTNKYVEYGSSKNAMIKYAFRITSVLSSSLSFFRFKIRALTKATMPILVKLIEELLDNVIVANAILKYIKKLATIIILERNRIAVETTRILCQDNQINNSGISNAFIIAILNAEYPKIEKKKI